MVCKASCAKTKSTSRLVFKKKMAINGISTQAGPFPGLQNVECASINAKLVFIILRDIS